MCDHQDSKLYCIDPWDDEYVKGSTLYDNSLNNLFKSQYYRFLDNTKNIKKIIPVKAYSDEGILSINDTFDFAFIDGDHSSKRMDHERSQGRADRVVRRAALARPAGAG